MTVKSCPKHNNEKTKDDIYVLAQICFNVIKDQTDKDASHVFLNNVFPQLKFNNNALERTIMKNRVRVADGYEFPVDMERMNAFFDCLTYGVIAKKIKRKFDIASYRVHHRFHDLNHKFFSEGGKEIHENAKDFMDNFMLSDTLTSINFSFVGKKIRNQEIYNLKIMGMDSLVDEDELTSSITVVHTFYGKFRVISLLTRIANFKRTGVAISDDFPHTSGQ
ncbi:hypothetical protein [Herbaspirillum sp. SJZ107]|uniref:hypothetical protein n=1 Tax=Herbaspirillum sp. SJZ107 TaxID=2572881 RepID=UPI001150AF44|nr:hypothetical protein [Herbaspirillum sp. SJZ107]TQK11226.1 hypothetical protein FBX97_1164 [Herbaspirillum sp. SJZ107]